MHHPVSKIAIGGVQFGLAYGVNNNQGKVSPEEVNNIINFSREAGIRTLDTARGYGNSETVLGDADLKGWKIVSKFSARSGSELVNEFNVSLHELKLKNIYAYLAHNPEILLGDPSLWDKLKELKELRLIEKIGFSLYYPSQLEKLLDLGYLPDLIQVQYNFLDRRFESYFDSLKSAGIEIHTRSCFLQGLFFSNSFSDFFAPLENFMTELRHFYPDKQQRASALLGFCLSNPFINRVVIGVQSLQELKTNLKDLSLAAHEELINITLPDIDEELLLPFNWPQRK